MSDSIYTVKPGDSLYLIAKLNGTSVEEIRRLNPNISNPNLIHVNLKILLKKLLQPRLRLVNVRNQWSTDENLSNELAIIKSQHSGNYGILDKNNRVMKIYDKSGNLLYTTGMTNSGGLDNDFNTVTYSENGQIVNAAGNQSTPAGISVITGIGEHEGAPSFTRARVDSNGKAKLVKNQYGRLVTDDIASSFHNGKINPDYNSTNGCVRFSNEDLQELTKYLTPGTLRYTLPQGEGSKFSLRDGKLNYHTTVGAINEKADASDMYSQLKTETRTVGDRAGLRFYLPGTNDGNRWTEYNTVNDYSYNPLTIKGVSTNENLKNKEYNQNAAKYINSLTSNKKTLMKKFNMTSDLYNHLAELALGIAEQESKFGTAISAKTKDVIYKIPFMSTNRSRGLTRIKYDADIKNKDLKELYRSVGITKASDLDNPELCAKATMARLAFIYNNQSLGKQYTTNNHTYTTRKHNVTIPIINRKIRYGKLIEHTVEGGQVINPYDVVLYAWSGLNLNIRDPKHSHLKLVNADPTHNTYINNVKKNAKNYNLYSTQTYYEKQGGRLKLIKRQQYGETNT